MTKKILFISTGITERLFDSGVAGGEVRLAKIMEEAIKEGLEVHFLVNSGGESFCQKFGLKGVSCYNFDFPDAKYSKFWHLWLTLKVFLTPPKGLEKFNEGFVYSANETLWDVVPALRVKLRNRKRIKWVAVVHWVPPLLFWRRRAASLINSFLFLLSERLSVALIQRFADSLLAVSQSTGRQLEGLGIEKKKIFPVGCGVNFDQIQNIIKGKRKKVYDAVFMKRIQAVKGIFDLVDIWELVVKKKPGAKLAIIGGGEDEKEAKRMVKKARLGKNVTFFGPIFDLEKKFYLLAQNRLFVVPSYEENWAIVFGEAMASKLSVLAYALPELIEVWQDSFISIPLGNKIEFANKILELLENKKKRERMAIKGWHYVQKYDWEKIAKEELRIILKLR